MTDKTAELETEVIKNQITKDLNRIQAILMLTSDGFFNSHELINMEPKLGAMFKDIEEGIAKL